MSNTEELIKDLVIAIAATNKACMGLMVSINQHGNVLPQEWASEDLGNMVEAEKKLDKLRKWADI